MGVVANAATDIGASLAKAGAGVGEGAACPLRMVAQPNGNKLGRNASQALDLGSKTSSVLRECSDMTAGIASGDLSNAAVNAGFLALYCVAGASNGGMKVGINSAAASSGLAKAAALGAASQTLQSTVSQIPEQGNGSESGSQDLGNSAAETSPLGSSSTNASSASSSSSTPVKNDEGSDETAGGDAEEDADAAEKVTRQTSMLSLGIIGAVTCMGMGYLGFRGEGEALGLIFGSVAMSAAQRSVLAPLELVRLRLQAQDPNEQNDDETKRGLSSDPSAYNGIIDCCRQVY